jgi:hypothetical protein
MWLGLHAEQCTGLGMLGRLTMEQIAFKNVNNCFNTNIYSYLATSVGQSSNLKLNVHFFQHQC